MKQLLFVICTFFIVVLFYGLCVRWYFGKRGSVQKNNPKEAIMYDIVGDRSEQMFTKAEIAAFDGSEDSPGLYLAIMGRVYDVSKGPQYYGPGGGYAFFSG